MAIPKTIQHTHDDKWVWPDDEILAHVADQHDVAEQPWMLNEGNRTLLVEEHEQAHEHDPIRL